MDKIIVTTTINNPTNATLEFCQKSSWKFIIVGDKKTPNDAYRELEKQYTNVLFLDSDDQEKKYKELSDAIGWNCIQRRNIGFIEAYKLGANIIATVDDDNRPAESWGQNLYVNKTIEVDTYEPYAQVFDPLSITEHNFIWHRGFPIELLKDRLNVEYKGKTRRHVLIQADLWDGDPDIDAMARLIFKPLIKFEKRKPWTSNKIMPFNSQNTFISRTVLPYYAVLPYVGRMDDIWGSYILQHYFPNCVIFNDASVYQDRNPQDLIKNLENELIGYRNTLTFIQNLKQYEKFLPKETTNFYQIYRKQFDIS